MAWTRRCAGYAKGALRRSSQPDLVSAEASVALRGAGEAPSACPRREPLDVKIGQRAELICWGVMPSGMLRQPVLAHLKP